MSRYSTYEGLFYCHKCLAAAKTARFYLDSYDFTWICPDKHLSKVNLWVRGY